MSKPVSQESLNQIFAEARSHHAWTSRPVAEETLRSLYEVMKWGPTSVNSLPARVVFVQSEAARAKLYPALMNSNVQQVKAAPVTAIIA